MSPELRKIKVHGPRDWLLKRVYVHQARDAIDANFACYCTNQIPDAAFGDESEWIDVAFDLPAVGSPIRHVQPTFVPHRCLECPEVRDVLARGVPASGVDQDPLMCGVCGAANVRGQRAQ